MSDLLLFRIRDAAPGESSALEELQRRSSDVWANYRAQLAAHPDTIQLPDIWIDNHWVRVAVASDRGPIGFSVVIPADEGLHELDGLFVEPAYMQHGVGSALVSDGIRRALATGARSLEVTAGPAEGFYEKSGFSAIAKTTTRFGPAVRMRRVL